ncbi:MAG TPA: hypothetical protein VLV50_20370 [Stellaceae bacterium]|nr:hypothetical protein [Stellaceae bacterium]
MAEIGPTPPIEIDPDVAAQIGRVAVMWSSLEFSVAMCIWELAQVSYAPGACMTAQIVSFEGRLRALLALLKFRKAPQRLIDEVNAFAEAGRAPLSKRNRIVHDMWIWDSGGNGRIARVEVDAPKKLHFEIKETTLQALKADADIIFAYGQKFKPLKAEIFAALPSLPEIPIEERYPIEDALLPRRSLTTP